ncbi:hypothetical protein D9615_010226 [Tricholomella constricta]|uniref:Uncharacterized protein n=1 Tax=Tricholomella constricta TaxID=117010 RepID=A0A8H5GR29_9AGAR|nr:hypothetical protein D9615_010226 [Tricholomella constricta]
MRHGILHDGRRPHATRFHSTPSPSPIFTYTEVPTHARPSSRAPKMIHGACFSRPLPSQRSSRLERCPLHNGAPVRVHRIRCLMPGNLSQWRAGLCDSSLFLLPHSPFRASADPTPTDIL